jgi:hypothetical protein
MDAACLDETAFGEIDPHDEDLLVLVWNWVAWAVEEYHLDGFIGGTGVREQVGVYAEVWCRRGRFVWVKVDPISNACSRLCNLQSTLRVKLTFL